MSDRFQVTPAPKQFWIDAGKSATVKNVGNATVFGSPDTMFTSTATAAWSLAPGASRTEDVGAVWVGTAAGTSSTITVDPIASGLAVDTGTGIPSAVGSGGSTASSVSFTPVGTIASTDVQAAIAETATDAIAREAAILTTADGLYDSLGSATAAANAAVATVVPLPVDLGSSPGATSTTAMDAEQLKQVYLTLDSNHTATVNPHAGPGVEFFVTQPAGASWTFSIYDGSQTTPMPVNPAVTKTTKIVVEPSNLAGTGLVFSVVGGVGAITGTQITLTGQTGAAQTFRVAGATASGAPASGAHLLNDAVLSLADATWYTCTVAGTPGTWVAASGATAPDATASVKGLVQLAGDLAGSGSTAAAPVITDLSVTPRKLSDLSRGGWLNASTISETLTRRASSLNVGTVALTSGTLKLMGGLVIPGGRAVNNLIAYSGGTAAATSTHCWFCLVDRNLNVVAKTVDDTAASPWAANTRKTLALSATYTPTNAIELYFGIVVVATTVPTLFGVVAPNIVTAFTALSAYSTTALTDPASLGGSAAALSYSSTNSGQIYAEVA